MVLAMVVVGLDPPDTEASAWAGEVEDDCDADGGFGWPLPGWEPAGFLFLLLFFDLAVVGELGRGLKGPSEP
jgi:hypothetical protein